MTVFDAHAHLGGQWPPPPPPQSERIAACSHASDLAQLPMPQEIEIRRRYGVRTAFSCGNPQQAAQFDALCREEPLFTMTAGVHPWYAADVTLAQMEPFMARCALIGEIGMDSVWCDTPLDIQRERFTQQLDWAASRGKGVVLHTKGCEMEIARLIEGFPHPVIVHWYSGDDAALSRYLAQGCYFTIGPDVPENVARLAPDDRILFETDGMDAVRWALGDVQTAQLPHILAVSVKKAALLRGQDAAWLAERANENYVRLMG